MPALHLAVFTRSLSQHKKPRFAAQKGTYLTAKGRSLFIKNSLSPNETVIGWLQKTDGLNEENRRKHIALIEEQFNCSIDIRWQASMTPFLYMGQQLRYGTVSREPDRLGFFTLDTTWDETELCCLVNNGERPSLYKGLLF